MKHILVLFFLIGLFTSPSKAEWINDQFFHIDIAPFFIDNGLSFRYVGSNTDEMMIVDLTNEYGIDGPYYSESQPILQIPSTIKVDDNTRPVTGLGFDAFTMARFDKIVLPASIHFIAERAFYNSYVSEIALNEGIRSIGDFSFTGCEKLNSIVMPNTLTYIGNNCFTASALKSVQFGNGLISIGNSNFNLCSQLIEITLPDGLQNIGSNNFNSCPKLKRVVIPRYLHFDECFNDCPEIAEIIVSVRDPYGFTNAFDKVDKSTCRVIVPEESLDKYRNAPGWKEFNLISAPTVNVEVIQSDNTSEEEKYYNLSGMRINVSSAHDGIVIKVTGKNAEKLKQ